MLQKSFIRLPGGQTRPYCVWFICICQTPLVEPTDINKINRAPMLSLVQKHIDYFWHCMVGAVNLTILLVKLAGYLLNTIDINKINRPPMPSLVHNKDIRE